MKKKDVAIIKFSHDKCVTSMGVVEECTQDVFIKLYSSEAKRSTQNWTGTFDLLKNSMTTKITETCVFFFAKEQIIFH